MTAFGSPVVDAVVDDEAARSPLSDDEHEGRPRASSAIIAARHPTHRCRRPSMGDQAIERYAAVVALATEKKVQPQAPALTEWAIPAGM